MAEPTTTTPTTPTEPQPGTEEYNAMMAARYREMQGRTEPPARPEHVPEKSVNPGASATSDDPQPQASAVPKHAGGSGSRYLQCR
jgi:hypothetical protein